MHAGFSAGAQTGWGMQQRHARHQKRPAPGAPIARVAWRPARDLQVILWMARAAGFGQRTGRKSHAPACLQMPRARDLKRAENAFRRLRVELHLLARRREDRLLFDLQHALADAYGITATPTRRASEILMQRYYWAARLVTQLNILLVQNIEERLFPMRDEDACVIDEDFVRNRNRLDIGTEDLFERKPSALLRVFLLMEQHPDITELSGRALRAIWHARHLIDADFRRDPVNKQTFLQILQQPKGIVHALRRMTMLNICPATCRRSGMWSVRCSTIFSMSTPWISTRLPSYATCGASTMPGTRAGIPTGQPSDCRP